MWFSHSEHEPPTNNMVGLLLSYTPKINYMINSKVAYFWLDIKIGWHVLSLSTVSRPKDPAMVGSVPQSVLWVVSGSSLLSQHHGSAHCLKLAYPWASPIRHIIASLFTSTRFTVGLCPKVGVA